MITCPFPGSEMSRGPEAGRADDVLSKPTTHGSNLPSLRVESHLPDGAPT